MARSANRVLARTVAAVAAVAVLPAGYSTASASTVPVQADTTSVTTFFSIYAVQGSDVVIQCAVSGVTTVVQETFNRNRAEGHGSLSCSGPADTKKIITGSNVEATLRNVTTGEATSQGATDCGNAPLHCPAVGGTLTCDMNSSGACNNRFRTYVRAYIVTNQNIDPDSLSAQCELLTSKTMECTTFNNGIIV